MGPWILILMVQQWGGGDFAITQSQGFASKAACELAGQAARKYLHENPNAVIVHVCVTQKEPTP